MEIRQKVADCARLFDDLLLQVMTCNFEDKDQSLRQKCNCERKKNGIKFLSIYFLWLWQPIESSGAGYYQQEGMSDQIGIQNAKISWN